MFIFYPRIQLILQTSSIKSFWIYTLLESDSLMYFNFESVFAQTVVLFAIFPPLDEYDKS